MNVRCNYCGNQSQISLWKLLFLLGLGKNKYYYTCPRCHKTSCFLLMFRIVHDSTDKKEKEINKQKLWDDRYVFM